METPELHTSLLQRAVFFLFAGSLGYWAGLTGASSVRIDDADDAKDSEASGKEDAAPSGAVVVDGVRMVHHADRSGGYAVRQVGPFTLQNTAYTRSIMWNIVVLGFISAYIYMNENWPLYPMEEKTFTWDAWWSTVVLMLVVAVCTLQRSREDTLLNRDQTDEWRGWMQFLFVLYHYHAASNLPVSIYNSIRVYVSAYVWMTGFGNFSFFYMKDDFSLGRFLKMLWRLDFLVIVIICVLGTEYILYYIVPMHTFYFAVVFVTMYCFRRYNHTVWGARIKILVLAVFIYSLWDTDFNLVQTLFRPFLFLRQDGSLHEWHFRTFLDHYSTLFGMVFAMNFPSYVAWLTRVEKLPAEQQYAQKGIVGCVLLGLMYWWYQNVFTLDKVGYNSKHPYFFWIPILTYIFFRNFTPTMRQYHSGFLHWLGKVTLETYLLQHHMFLISNHGTFWKPTSLHVLIPGSPRLNMLVVGIVFVLCSYYAFTVTLTLRDAFIVDEPRAMLQRTLYAALAIIAALIVALIVPSSAFDALISGGLVAVVSFAVGLYLFKS